MRAVRLCGLTVVAALWAAASARGLAADSGAGFRPLASGVLTVVPAPVPPPGAAAAATDTVSRADLLDITVGRSGLAWKPLQSPPHTTFVERGRDREYARDVWNLEFAFKPPRMIDVDVPVAGLRMQRKRIWYLVYRVRNAGGRRPVIDPNDAARRSTEPFETSIRFVPQFVLESLEPLDAGEGLDSYRAYLDRVIPTALGPIRAREAGGRELLDSAAMVAKEIAPGEERWGVATWEDVDPRIDFFSIYVRGLSNAVTWRPRAGAPIKATDPPGRAMEQALRTLRLDFWRPGDERDEAEEEMSVGFAGMFERMTLGSRLLEAVAIRDVDAARPVEGLRALDLVWSDADLLEEIDAVDPSAGAAGGGLKPLRAVVGRLARLADPAARGQAVQSLFGDTGVLAFEDLASALAGPVDADRDAARRAELARLKLDLTPETVQRKPLESLAQVLRALEAEPRLASRRAAAARLFGPAGRRVEALARQVALARTLAALEALEVPPALVAAGDARAAFDTVRPVIEGLDEVERSRIIAGPREPGRNEAEDRRRAALAALPDERRARAVSDLVLQGLFGARGPGLFAAAAAFEEGIDHAWVFRYENTMPGS